MVGPDAQELRAYYRQLSDDAIAELHAAGSDAYVPAAWALLDEEFRARGAPAETAEQHLLAERHRQPPPDVPPDLQREAIELVTVFASGDVVQLTVAKLALQSEGIPFITKGEGVQDLVGFGRLFGGLNLVSGPVQIQVRRQDANLALELLEELRHSSPEPLAPPDAPADPS